MSIPSLFIRTAVLLGLAGMLLGIFMGINQDFRLAHFHAHWNLLGWVAFFIYGAYYALVPAARQGVLPKVHYVLALLGLGVFVIGLYGVGHGRDGDGRLRRDRIADGGGEFPDLRLDRVPHPDRLAIRRQRRVTSVSARSVPDRTSPDRPASGAT